VGRKAKRVWVSGKREAVRMLDVRVEVSLAQSSGSVAAVRGVALREVGAVAAGREASREGKERQPSGQ
jgi:hypothetical protein